jgi:superfamily II DNA/RNA helicase
VVVQSGTGTGKTLAYLLPVLQRLRQSPGSRAVCLAPSTELAMQVMRVAERYKQPDLSSVALVTRGDPRRKAGKLQNSTRLVVGTPELVLEMFANRKLKGVTLFVLDEPEPILASRNAEYLREVLSRPEPKLQLVFVGATFGVQSERWLTNLLGSDVTRTKVADDPLTNRIKHQYVRVRHEGEKDFALARFIRKHGCKRAIVFVNQPNLVRHLYRYLNEQSLPTVTVSAERNKQQCKQALADFGSGKAQVLLTTDAVALGLDVPHVEWVLHFELPNSVEAFVHRAGRTGRAGQTGTSVLFLSEPDRPRLKRFEQRLGFPIPASEGAAPPSVVGADARARTRRQ